MVGPSGMMKMTDSVLAVLASKGVIEEAGKTGYWKEKTDNSQPWQEARQEARHGSPQEAGGALAGGWWQEARPGSPQAAGGALSAPPKQQISAGKLLEGLSLQPRLV